MTRRYEALSILVILAAVIFLLREPILFGKSFCTVDVAAYKPWDSVASRSTLSNNALNDQVFAHLPRKAMYREAVLSGHLPRWSNGLMNGFPIGSDPHFGWYDPFNLFLVILSIETASIVIAFLQLFLGGIFAYLFLKELGLRRSSAIFGAVAFIAQPFFATHLTMPTNIQSAFWLPLLLYIFERAIKSHKPGRTILLSAPAMALSVLGGFPPTFTLCIVAWGAYAMLRLVLAEPDEISRSGKSKLVRALIVAGAIGSLLASIQLFPSIRLSRYSDRSVIPFEEIKRVALPAVFLKTLLNPYVFGQPTAESWSSVAEKSRPSSNAFSPASFMEDCHYVGLAVMAMMIAALWFKRRDRKMWIVFFFVASSLLILYGTPLLWIAYKILPGFKAGRPDRIIYLFGSFAAFLAAIGLDAVVKKYLSDKPTLAIILSAIVISVCALDMGVLWGRFNTFQDRWFPEKVPGSISFLEGKSENAISRLDSHPGSDSLPPNSPAIYGISDVQGRNALTLRHYGRFMNAIEPDVYKRSKRIFGFTKPESLSNKLFALLNVKYLIAEAPLSDVSLPQMKLEYDGEVKIYENTAATMEAWVVGEVIVVKNEEEALEAIKRPDFDPYRQAVVESDSDIPNGKPGRKVMSAEVSDEKISIRVSGWHGGLLVLPKTWYPEWTVLVNGWPQRVYKTDAAFMGVQLSNGPHDIEFQYQDRFFMMGWIMSLLGIISFIVVWMAES